MLDPNGRSLYADSLRPPPGRVFDEAIATTYTLGLDTLLTVPLQLALFDRRDAGEGIRDGVAVLEALRRTSERLSVFCQAGRIHVPSTTHVLYGMLEPIVHAVRAPGGGAFHAKLWVLRFVDPEGALPPLLRVLVLSRNLTFDRSWDLSLRMDGEVTDEQRDENRDEAGVLADFLRRLPSLSVDGLPGAAGDRAERLASDLARTRFERPDGFRRARFFVNGLGGSSWQPETSDELVIVSPFCDDKALAALAASSTEPLALISRVDELDRLAPSTRAKFGRVLVLDETAESEDGEDLSAEPERLHGLHAKAYLQRIGSDLHVVMGSANATHPGLFDGRNVELLVELVGPVAKLGGAAEVLESDGFGAVLQEFKEPEAPPAVDAAARAAEDLLSAARERLAVGGLSVVCESGPGANIGGSGDGNVGRRSDGSVEGSSDGSVEGSFEGSSEGWKLRLVSREAVALEGLCEARAWPVTLTDDRAMPLEVGSERVNASLGALALVSMTGFVAFELGAPIAGTTKKLRTRFVLNLPIEGLPEGREAAVMRTVIANQEGFLRYLALLLAELEDDPIATSERTAIDWTRWLAQGSGEDLALLEPLVRALARDPERLEDVRQVVERIRAGEGAGQDVIPAEFLDLWESFEAALELGR